MGLFGDVAACWHQPMDDRSTAQVMRRHALTMNKNGKFEITEKRRVAEATLPILPDVRVRSRTSRRTSAHAGRSRTSACQSCRGWCWLAQSGEWLSYKARRPWLQYRSPYPPRFQLRKGESTQRSACPD